MGLFFFSMVTSAALYYGAKVWVAAQQEALAETVEKIPVRDASADPPPSSEHVPVGEGK